MSCDYFFLFEIVNQTEGVNEQMLLLKSEKITLMIGSVYQDQTVKRIINVVDNKQIVMSLNGSQNTSVKRGQTYIESGSHAVDQDEGNITDRVEASGEVNVEVTRTAADFKTVGKLLASKYRKSRNNPIPSASFCNALSMPLFVDLNTYQSRIIHCPL